jgi:4-cresol dehydrogenase (hydroxylating) flavoprotein subunit
MGNAKLTEEECTWPARLGSWAERSPSSPTLCRSERDVPWRLRPPDLECVRQVIREAAANRTPLWPVSTGRNWGYGSHLPARDGAVVLDLSALDAIGDLDRPSLSVRIEPGVTQKALHEFLARSAPDLAFNVTGSGGQTSVLGNALERGIGYSGEKDQEVYALEVVLADGSMSGPTKGINHKSRSHPSGPSTDGLFFQSSYGVVVGARIRLRLRQEAEDAVVLQGTLEGVMATLKAAYDSRLVTDPTHVSEPGRTQRLGFGLLRNLWQRDPTPEEVSRCFPEKNSYNGLVPLRGRRRVVDAAWKELSGAAAPGVRLQRADAAKLDRGAKWLRRVGASGKADRLLALRPLLALAWGEPSDVGLASLDGYKDGNPDLARRGAIYGNAVSSVGADEAKRTAAIVRALWKDCAFTWIVLDSRCMITIYTLHFDDASSVDARAANAVIVDELGRAGFPLYRGGINVRQMQSGTVASRLKEALDPMGIISPGRYEP